ncbi:MAG: hypothetical protein P4N59_21755 [Negativicutes bacterium]|nr:hypothetical protein [Negativicutes bacterium]
MKTPFILFLLFCVLLAVACKRKPALAALATNQMPTNPSVNLIAENELRQELGLRIIKETWILYRVENGQELWKIHSDGFPVKSVFKDGGKRVLADEDYYYSGNEFFDQDGHGWERITVHYDFNSKQVYVAYTGTNKATEAILSKFFMTIDGPSLDVGGAVGVVRKVAINWPDGPK